MKPIPHTISSFLAELRNSCAPSAHESMDLQANAAFWMAVKVGITSDPCEFWARSVNPIVDHVRLVEAPYLAAVGYLVDAGTITYEQRMGAAFTRVVSRAPHTMERTGIADDPLCLVGLFLLSRADEDATAASTHLLRLLRDIACDDQQSASVMLLLALADGSLVDSMRPWGHTTQPDLYSAVIAQRAPGDVGTRLFPLVERRRIEDELLRSVCAGRVKCIAEDWNTMLLLVALELIVTNVGFADVGRPMTGPIDLGNHPAFGPVPDLKQGSVPADTTSGRRTSVTMTPLTILFLGANPSDTTRLALQKEAQEIDNRLRTADLRDAFRVEQQWEVQAEQLLGKIMRFKPNILHFSGHGDSGGELVFQDRDGRATAAKKEVVARLFSLLGKDIKCVLLNACYSAAQAETIAQHVDVVIGMSQAIGDADAIRFAGAFYEALGYGKDVYTAFELAKLAIDLARLPAGAVPQLCTRPSVDPQQIVLASHTESR